MNKIITLDLSLEPADNTRLANLCGPFDDNIKQLERRLSVEISYRGNQFSLVGKSHTVQAASNILKNLYIETAPVQNHYQDITPEKIHPPKSDFQVSTRHNKQAFNKYILFIIFCQNCSTLAP